MVLPLPNPTKSYWIEAAESPLKDFRSTVDLPPETDVVIIGSGYSGASTAYWLHKYTENDGTTPEMLLLEARDICGSATGRNGGQLRPHAYSRYPIWSELFGADGALALIKHEMAHLPAFQNLLNHEGIAEEVCFKLGETFDAAMTEEAWTRLKGAYEEILRDHGKDGEVIRDCRLISDAKEAEDFTQMKGCLGAVVHPAGQIWPYKFVHALLRIVLKTGKLNLQAHTPVMSVSERDSEGWIKVTTSRGVVRARAVVHATNAWASHLLPQFGNIILPSRATVAAIKAPQGFIKHTGAQHWDSTVNNYHIQLPAPYNAIIVGGGKAAIAHKPYSFIGTDAEDTQFDGVPEYFQSWPRSDITGWSGKDPAGLGLDVQNGGCWTGTESSSIDAFPFVGAVPSYDGHYILSGFTGHGMPRILLSAAHITPLILKDLDIDFTPPSLVESFPPLPKPFLPTNERIERLQKVELTEKLRISAKSSLESANKSFCVDVRNRLKLS